MSLIDLSYRFGVGIIVLNKDKEVFVAHRYNNGPGTETLQAPILEEDQKKIKENKTLDQFEHKNLPDLRDYLWQMPQGGMDAGESVEETALRELFEETGIKSVKILKVGKKDYFYDLPEALSLKVWEGKYKGQCQRWVLMTFLGEDSEINLEAHDIQEFDAWRWISPNVLPDIVTPFKRDLYKNLLIDFELV
ncbi:MAG: RNA pyrophosphohydrolase [Alphaproteobacteria bacterium 16-39-46]|nr:MAG: RNA pyrophosphohydrolase [Alphaproteobacteria bacterium 16-39-46]OZA44432.1 MAG: RNA pyrophosphohydrolase [Alphaproteobacteria bacterium 17-39-52]HQS83318.1 RNA pyrophosphohydrolase [Alphaproteobacteria bacterium]HQS93140.1 RNA pyrophosphohydrolase [Alphaproteobacteria bacterium]